MKISITISGAEGSGRAKIEATLREMFRSYVPPKDATGRPIQVNIQTLIMDV